MAVKTCHMALTLRGDSVVQGIKIEEGLIQFRPRWGMTRQAPNLLATSPGLKNGNLELATVAITSNGTVLFSSSENPTRELVLVQEYQTGSGAKRLPGFGVEFGEEIRKLSSTWTSGGSGYELWTLVSAPIGWATNIAGQFQNFKDVGSQTISYEPEVRLEDIPEPFEAEGMEIAEAVLRLLGDAGDALAILTSEYEAPYGRARRQSVLVATIPGIENDPATKRLVGARTASTLNQLLKQAIAYLEKGTTEQPVDEEDSMAETPMAAALRKAGLC